MKRNNVMRVLLLLVACWLSLDSLAQRPPVIGKLSKLDLKFMTQQRDTLQDLAAANLGRQFSGNRDRDLALLQSLLDKNLIRADQTRELQAMGVIMGDLLSAEFDLHWVIYEDNLGRTRALRYRDSDNFLFPITMISRRREAGNQATVPDIYQKASDIIAATIPALPFQ